MEFGIEHQQPDRRHEDDGQPELREDPNRHEYTYPNYSEARSPKPEPTERPVVLRPPEDTEQADAEATDTSLSNPVAPEINTSEEIPPWTGHGVDAPILTDSIVSDGPQDPPATDEKEAPEPSWSRRARLLVDAIDYIKPLESLRPIFVTTDAGDVIIIHDRGEADAPDVPVEQIAFEMGDPEIKIPVSELGASFPHLTSRDLTPTALTIESIEARLYVMDPVRIEDNDEINDRYAEIENVDTYTTIKIKADPDSRGEEANLRVVQRIPIPYSSSGDEPKNLILTVDQDGKI